MRVMLFYVGIVELITAFGAEFWRVVRIFRFPSAFIALIQRCVGRFFLSAVCTEFTLVDRTAFASPAVVFGLRITAVRAEISCIFSAARALP